MTFTSEPDRYPITARVGHHHVLVVLTTCEGRGEALDEGRVVVVRRRGRAGGMNLAPEPDRQPIMARATHRNVLVVLTTREEHGDAHGEHGTNHPWNDTGQVRRRCPGTRAPTLTFVRRGGGIRTRDLVLPKHVR